MPGAEVMIGGLPVLRVLKLELFVAVITNARETQILVALESSRCRFIPLAREMITLEASSR